MDNPFEILSNKISHLEEVMVQILSTVSSQPKRPEVDNDVTFSAKALAEYLGCSVQTVNKHKRAGNIPFHNACGVVFFKKSEIDRVTSRITKTRRK